MIKAQILQQAGLAITAQANALPQSALALLQYPPPLIFQTARPAYSLTRQVYRVQLPPT
ncbi:flagellin [Zhongshania borealis]|uniref:flagellin n=1 Tax=Zhongshania borealis TaxID=889488 RepID=UPI0031EAD304